MLDISVIAVSSVIVFLTFITFIINYSIYRRTIGGSYGFMCWAISSGCYFVGRSITLLGILITQSVSFLLTRGIGEGFFEGLGGFFALIGMIFLGIDLKIFKCKKQTLKKIQIPFIIFTLILFSSVIISGYMNIITQSYAIEIVTSLGAIFEIILWGIAGIIFYPLYQILKKGTKAWTLLYLGIISVVLTNIAEIFLYIGYQFFGTVKIIISAFYAIFLLSGFFLLNKSLKG